MNYLQKTDKTVAKLIATERKRQEETLMMIPSENTASRAVEEAVGSCLGNKYAEGYAYKRYYQGQAVVDELETLVVDRAKKLFGVVHANVQPYSGSPANLAVLLGILSPGDTILGLALASGGHLTHGAAASVTGRLFDSIQYDVTKSGYIDYAGVERLAREKKPKLIIAGTTAYPRHIDWKRFGEIAESVGAYLLADVSHISGLIVGGAYPSPVSHVHIITTTTHKSLRGPRGAMIMVTEKGMKKDPDLAKKIDKAVFPGLQGGPHENAIAGIGVALQEASGKQFPKYAKQIVENAIELGNVLQDHGFELVSGGTDSHLLLVDLQTKGLLGNTVAEGCEAVGIVLNRNAVPFDPNPPFYPSGIRLGTPGVTSRAMKKAQMKVIGLAIHDAVEALRAAKDTLGFGIDDEKSAESRAKIIKAATPKLKQIRERIDELCTRFPLKDTYV